jgi:hypothetical protein
MSRLVFLVLVAICSATPARAALLVNYSFNGNLAPTVNNLNTVSQDAQTVSFNAPTTFIETTTTGSTATFYIGSSNAGFTTISDVKFQIAKLNNTTRSASYKVFFFTGWSGGTYLGEAQDSVGFATLPSNTITILASSISGLGNPLTPNQKIRAVLQITTSGTPLAADPAVVAVDNFQFNGAAVPEPASMAAFGALGLGLFLRRRLTRSVTS